MNTQIYKMSEQSTDIAAINACAGIIKSGGLVVFPTETVYGVGTNALDDSSCAKIYKAKKRPQDKALLCHIYDIETADKIAVLSKQAYDLLELFVPGPLTLILPKKSCIGNIVSAGMETVGLRFPSNPICRELMKAAGVPIAATSANISGEPSPTDGENAVFNMNGRADAIIDGGATDFGKESTIITLCEEIPRILRHGAISDEMIRRVLPKCV